MRRRRPSARSLTCLDTGRQGFGSRWCANRCGQLHAGGQIGTGFGQEPRLARICRAPEIGGKFDSTGRNHENRKCPSQEWACGAAGSALPWHGRGHRFDPGQVHQNILQKNDAMQKSAYRLAFSMCIVQAWQHCYERCEAIGEWGVQVGLRMWRRDRDSNPGYLAVYTLSKRAP